jgi:uncharacterized protein DUF4375
MNPAEKKKFLESYGGQSVDQLITLEAEYRIDSLVLAFEQAIDQKRQKEELSQVEMDILAVEAMEREVNNGGYHQFFLNTSEFGPLLPSALERIGCPVTAKITSDALAYLELDGPVTVAKIDAALVRLGDQAITDLGEMDERYFQYPEPIADKLFAYIKAKKAQIHLKR